MADPTTAAAEKKKANLAAFFGKNKAAKKVEATPPAAAPESSSSASTSTAEPTFAPADTGSGWVDAPQEPQRVALGSKFSGRVGDLDELEAEEGAHRADIEAEEAKCVPVENQVWYRRVAFPL